MYLTSGIVTDLLLEKMYPESRRLLELIRSLEAQFQPEMRCCCLKNHWSWLDLETDLERFDCPRQTLQIAKLVGTGQSQVGIDFGFVTKSLVFESSLFHFRFGTFF